ncbi:hypothetical protein P7C70_g1128, partial [Phenoliferia sp. Uapishka_3]
MARPPRQSTSAAQDKASKRPREKEDIRDPAIGAKRERAAGTVPQQAGGKGKGKALQQESEPAPECWRDKSSLLAHSFNLFRLGPLHNFPISSTSSGTSSKSAFLTLSKAMKVFLERQSAFEEEALGNRPFTVEAGFVDCLIHGASRQGMLPVSIEVGRTNDEDAPPTDSIFVLLPASCGTSLPILLARSTPAALTNSIITFLSTRYDTLITPLRLPTSTMLKLLESLVASRDPTSVNSTSLTFAFPSKLALEGLSSLTLSLPPPLIDCLAPLEGSNSDDEDERHRRKTMRTDGPFLAALSDYFQDVTAFNLGHMQLVRLGGGRGTFVHSGQSASAGDGAKLKFYKAAGEDGELEDTLKLLVKEVEPAK